MEPTGPFEDDPNLTDKRFPGNPTRSYRTREPLRVVGEVLDWEPHSPEVLQNMQKIEGAIMRADEMMKQSNYAGAWESVEKVAGDFPDDSKLNQMRANLTTQAADFVRTLRNAQDLDQAVGEGIECDAELPKHGSDIVARTGDVRDAETRRDRDVDAPLSRDRLCAGAVGLHHRARDQDAEGDQHRDARHPDAQLELLQLALGIAQLRGTHHMVCSRSARRCGRTVRTITALTTCPFLTVPSGDASLTEALITSPMCP